MKADVTGRSHHATPRPLRVARIYSALELGGIERQLCLTLPALRERGAIEPHLLLMRHAGPLAPALREQGVPVEVVRTRGRFGRQAAGLLARVLRQLEIDVVHAHAYEASATATAAAWWAGRLPAIAQYHTIESFSLRKRWQEKLLNSMRYRVLCVADAVRAAYLAQVGGPPSRVETFPNAVPLPPVTDAHAARLEARRRLGVESGVPLALMVGRLVAEKAPQRALEAVAALRGDGVDLRLALIGDGALRPELEALAARLQIAERVTFAGQRDDVEALLPGADLFLSTSIREGRSNAILEAMAAACPIVATDVGGTGELIRSGETGLLVPSESAGPLRDALRQVLSDPIFAAGLARGARHAAEQFGLARLLPRLEDMYRDAHGHTARGGANSGEAC